MHFIYYINRLTATKVDSTYLGCLTSNAQRICPVAGLKRTTTGLVVSALPYRATQVDNLFNTCFPPQNTNSITAFNCSCRHLPFSMKRLVNYDLIYVVPQ